MPSSPATGSSRSRRPVQTPVSDRKIYLDLSSDSDEYDDTNPLPRIVASSSSKRRKVRDLTSYCTTDAGGQIELSPDTSDDEVDNLEHRSEDDDEEEEDEEEYEIDYIVNSRYRVERGKKHLEYYVHWLNYGKDDRSWTDAAQFDDDDPPVLDFYAKFPTKPGHPRKPVKVITLSKSPVTSRSRVSTSSPVKQPKRIEVQCAPVRTIDKLPTAGISAANTSRMKPIAVGDLKSFFSRIDDHDAKEAKDTKGKGKARDVELKPNSTSRGKENAPLQKRARRQSVERAEVVEFEASDFEMDDSFVGSEDDESGDDDFVSAEEGSEAFGESVASESVD